MPVANDPRAAGDGAAVAAALADDRRGFAGDGGFIHAGDAFDHLAIGRDDVAGFADHQVALLQLRARGPVLRVRRVNRRAMVSLRALRRLSACALPRPSATASAKLANSTVNQSQIASCAMNPRSVAEVKMPDGGEDRADHG